MSAQPVIRVVTEATLNDSLNKVNIRTRNGGELETDQAWEPGHYICEQEPGGPFVVVEGPLPGEAYAIHRAQTRHGMARTAGEDEATEDWLPW